MGADGAMRNPGVRLAIVDEDRAAFVAYARGRRLVVDYWEGTYGCGGIASGDVFLRWEATTSPANPNLVPIEGLGPVVGAARSEIASLLEQGVFKVAIRGRGPFRKPILLLVKQRIWLEYLGNVPLGA